MRRLAAVLALLAAGCGRSYDRFTLPSPGAPENGGYEWTATVEPVAWESSTAAPNERSGHGPADDADALNPSVVRFGPGLLNLYSGFDGKLWRRRVNDCGNC